MSDTVNLALPLIAAAQSQKHVTHNEALAILDALSHLAVISRALASPPALPLDGDRYLIAAGGSGTWAGHDGELAFYLDGVWRFAAPRTGWRLWSLAEEKLLAFDGSSWRDIQDISELEEMELLGINTTADAASRLAVASQSVLFTHDGGDQRVKINKHASGDAAALLFQTNSSGRAEIGTNDDDDLRLKVSANGLAWTDAIAIDRANGQAKFVAGSTTAPGVAVGGAGNGMFLSTSLRFALAGTETFRCNANGIGIGADPTSVLRLLVQATGSDNATFVVQGEASANGSVRRYSNDITAPAFILRKARGTIAAPNAPAQDDACGELNYGYWDGASSFRTNCTLRATVRAATPSATDGEARLLGLLCPAASVTPVEIFRFDHATGFSMFGSNVVITQNRHVRKRQYAAGALPAQSSGDEIASCDIVAATLVSDGTEWLSPGVKRLRSIAANTTLSVSAGWSIDQIFVAETAGNAVTGGVRIGTTAGGSDVVSAQAVGANSLGEIAAANIAKKVFSRSTAQTLFIEAVGSWNSATVELSFALRKVF